MNKDSQPEDEEPERESSQSAGVEPAPPSKEGPAKQLPDLPLFRVKPVDPKNSFDFEDIADK